MNPAPAAGNQLGGMICARGFATVAVLLVASTAHAQAQIFAPPTTITLPAPVTPRSAIAARWPAAWFFFGGIGDASGDAGAIEGLDAGGPLRLGLMAESPWIGTGDPACASADGATAAAPTIPTERARQIELVPRLTLSTFSRFGCARDGVIGGGMAYTVPLKKGVSLVLSGGFVHMPQLAPGHFVPPASQVRADLVFQRSEKRWTAIGIGTRGFWVSGTF